MYWLSVYSPTGYVFGSYGAAGVFAAVVKFVRVRFFFLLNSLELCALSAYANRWFIASFTDKYLFVIFSWATWANVVIRNSCVLVLFTTSGVFFSGMSNFITLTGEFISLYFTHVFGYLFDTLSVLGELFYAPYSAIYGDLRNVFLWISNPQVDIDLTTNTDCEDMLAFFGDIVEFAEQDKALFIDAAFDVWFNLHWGSTIFMFEAFVLTQLRRQTLSIFLAKFFNA